MLVDELFKREADAYRKKSKTPSLLEKGLNASFFKHELMTMETKLSRLNISMTLLAFCLVEQLMMF